MSKRNREKRIRYNGVVLSRLNREDIKVVKQIRAMFGDEPFNNVEHHIWKEAYKRFISVANVDRETLAHFVISQAVVSVIGMAKWKSIYVISEAVVDFLENSDIRDSDPNLVYRTIDEIAEDSMNVGLVVHFANRKDSAVFLCNNGILKFKVGQGYGIIKTNSNDDMWENYYKNLDLTSKKVWNTIINLFMYMDVFPECVKEGPPSIDIPRISSGHTKTVSTSKPIEEVYKQTHMSPHMRRGHFRVLKNPRYTHMLGKTVYVKPAMVRGSVRTVTENAS